MKSLIIQDVLDTLDFNTKVTNKKGLIRKVIKFLPFFLLPFLDLRYELIRKVKNYNNI